MCLGVLLFICWRCCGDGGGKEEDKGTCVMILMFALRIDTAAEELVLKGGIASPILEGFYFYF